MPSGNGIEEEFEHKIYSYFGSDCFFHLARVTAGVDSALIGETEIQGQVKRAYETAHAYRPLASELHFLVSKVFEDRQGDPLLLSILFGLPSIEEAIHHVATGLFGNILKKKILFVGLSEINHKIFARFKKIGCRNLFLCNRSHDKALEVARKEAVNHLPWEQLAQWPYFDFAIFGTKCPHFLVTRDHLKIESTCRLVIDLSVPRNVDPKIGRHPITLLNVDQLNKAIDRKRKLKALDLARIETQCIAQSVTTQLSLFRRREAQISPAIFSAVG